MTEEESMTIKMDHLIIHIKVIDPDSKHFRKGCSPIVTREVLEGALGHIPMRGLEEMGIMMKLEPVFKREKK